MKPSRDVCGRVDPRAPGVDSDRTCPCHPDLPVSPWPAVAGTTALVETRFLYVGVLGDTDWDAGQVA